MFIAAIHNGGLVIGAYVNDRLIGFVFGFPGLESTPDGPRPKHCSHMMGIHPQYRDSAVGFVLKRAQWQIVRHQGLDHVTWTYDPLLSRNAYLNISKLGAVCNTYRRAEMAKCVMASTPVCHPIVFKWIGGSTPAALNEDEANVRAAR